jgi:hypothetical protein
VAGLPETVHYPDGHDEPFVPERITRQLFHAGESLGYTDPFFARELTDGVLHFLALECDGQATTPTAIAETVSKVVRELGHPQLALAYEGRPVAPPPNIPAVAPRWPEWFNPAQPPWAIAQHTATLALTDLSTQALYPRELVSAHVEGLLHLGDLATPLELATYVLPVAWPLAPTLRQARLLAGQGISIDMPEYALAEQQLDVADYLAILGENAALLGVQVALHLNSAGETPSVTGPLFGTPTPQTEQLDELRTAFLHAPVPPNVSFAWHGAATNSDTPLHALALERALAGQPIEFIVDRPKRPIILGAGLTRQHPAVLSVVGMNVQRLVEQMGGTGIDMPVFLRKVASLARFAKTAGHVRQDFLRKHGRPALREGFLLERARLLVVPLGLYEAASALGSNPTDTAKTILSTIKHALDTDRPRRLPCAIDLSTWFDRDPGLTPKQRTRQVGMLHAITDSGSARFPTTNAQEAQRLAFASEVQRFVFGD